MVSFKDFLDKGAVSRAIASFSDTEYRAVKPRDPGS